MTVRPPRPPNAYLLFRRQERTLPQYEGQTECQISRATGAVWRSMLPEQRAPWIARAREVAIQHAQTFPGYRYMPSTRKRRKRKTAAGPHPASESSGSTTEDALATSELRSTAAAASMSTGSPVLSPKQWMAYPSQSLYHPYLQPSITLSDPSIRENELTQLKAWAAQEQEDVDFSRFASRDSTTDADSHAQSELLDFRSLCDWDTDYLHHQDALDAGLLSCSGLDRVQDQA
ncbi:unnamed protein product [Mycena citricolor]|uniref:HMG box domain-containing protein n=1 Tax=Mycena citricolor TaxID=2018698 RepID=A0AAD2JYH1_9AGAR|nr:unnamed protein product [Mycena citricolor]